MSALRVRHALPLVLVAFALPTPALAGSGRLVAPSEGTVPERTVDAGYGVFPVALPGGDTLLVRNANGTLTTRTLTAAGALTPPTATVTVPGPRFTATQVLRMPDGRLRVLGTTAATSRYMTPQLVVAGLSADGTLDLGFGLDGVVPLDLAFGLSAVGAPGLQQGCGGCSPMALTPYGDLMISGSTGQIDPGVATDPNAANSFRWVLARLTTSGRPDLGFGVDGRLPVPGTEPGGGAGYGVIVGADGRMTALGGKSGTTLLTRLLPDGTPDPTFANGAPIAVPTGFSLAALPDGGTLLTGFGSVARITAGGAADQGFGTGGTLTFPEGRNVATGLVDVAADGGATVFTSTFADARPVTGPTLILHRFDAAGHDSARAVRLGFGGGLASFYRTAKVYRPVPALAQDGFSTGAVLPRPGGGYLVLGSVAERQYTGEGAGFSGAQFAAAALTPALALDASFGPDRAPATIRTELLPQHAAGVRRLRGVAVRVTASGPGLVLLRVRDGAGRVLAEGVEPVYAAGSSTMRVQIAKAGADRLRHATKVRIGTHFRDVLGVTADGAQVTGTLRG